MESVNGQHRGGGHPYGDDDPTPQRSDGREQYGPRHGSSRPDDDRNPPADTPPDHPAYQAPPRPPSGDTSTNPFPPADPSGGYAQPGEPAGADGAYPPYGRPGDAAYPPAGRAGGGAYPVTRGPGDP